MPPIMLVATLLSLSLAGAGLDKDPLAEGFRNPPDSARPHTWWHWMDGNATKEGITADLEAMKEAGIGGAQLFTVAQGIPKGPADYLSPLWRELTVHAVREASRLGIEICLHNCAGWSSSGGPWVKPEHGMQVVAWSQVKVLGPKRFDEALPPIEAPQVVSKVPYSRDIAVFALKEQGTPPGPSRQLFLGRTGVIRLDGLLPTPGPESSGGPPERIVDVTTRMDREGRLRWDVPEGQWTILRMGHVPTGKKNHPAPPEGEGLEVDKMSREAMDAFWAGTMATVIRDVGPLAGKTLNNALIDSYEVHGQNWTPRFREEFRKRRGYDCLPWLPVLTGRHVRSDHESRKFLWDFRRTIADLFADNYFGYFAELCQKNGMQFSVEGYGDGNFDNLQVGGLADVPMGEFWIGSGGMMETAKLAASSAHTYGRRIVGAESFTADDVRGRWLEEPFGFKALGDLAFCLGINRYIFHRYAHQPWMDKLPGMTMGPWGTHLERTQTWWTEAKEWLRYVARCQFLLQQGEFVADALYFVGESAPSDLPSRPNLKPSLPSGYDYDGCDATAFLKLRVRNGRVALPSGMSYRVLILPPNEFMTPRAARHVRKLVRDGAIVVGPKPSQSPSLTGYPHSGEEVRTVAQEVWGSEPEPNGRRVGAGRVYSTWTLDKVFANHRLPPDFEFRGLSGGAKLAYIHRRIAGDDVYFVSNQNYRPAVVEATFRVAGRMPELWHPDSGRIEPAPVFRETNGRTTVRLNFDPAGSMFVLFRKPASGVHLAEFGMEEEPTLREKMPEVRILKARYEAADGRGADVTETVRQMVKEGNYEIPASNSAFGDPVVNVVKRLVVEFELDGKRTNKTVAENELLVLAEWPIGATGRTFELERSSAGGVWLTAWKKGRYVGKRSDSLPVAFEAEGPLEMALAGPWRLTFPPNLGAPAEARLMRLISWSEHPDPGVRYFSGSATYVKEFFLPADMVGQGRAVRLDLGRVKHFATVRLNGTELSPLWKEPYAADVTQLARAGTNRLEIKVTNLWVNRLIGDEQHPPDAEWEGVRLKNWPDWVLFGKPRPVKERVTFTTWKFWNKDSPLLESGLLGPVVVRSARKIELR
jgi:hypothetical protein